MMAKTRGLEAEDLKRISDSFEDKSAQDVLAWAIEQFHPDIALACSFGAEDMALVDMLVKIKPDAKIFYLDTGVLFPETLQVRDRIVERYGIEPLRYAGISLEEQVRLHGDELWSRQPNVCCDIRKVQPLTRALEPLQAWITGIRRDQSPTRANAGIVQWDQKFSLVKVNPLARWTWDEVWEYIRENKVPYNVLHDQGYPSIGCAPCTQPVQGDSTDRSGRWAGSGKTECGLHQ